MLSVPPLVRTSYKYSPAPLRYAPTYDFTPAIKMQSVVVSIRPLTRPPPARLTTD